MFFIKQGQHLERVELFDQQSIHQIQWPKSPESTQAQMLPLSMLKQGVERYITNTKTAYYFLRLDHFILPLTVNSKEYDNSYLTSNYYAVNQMHENWPKVFRPVASAIGLLLKGFKVNRSVVVNNWLLSNSLYPKLTDEQVALLTTFLEKRFPDHLLMFRGLNDADTAPLIQQLKSLGYHTFFARKIFIYNPKVKKESRVAYHQRRDLRLLEKGGYRLEDSQDFERLITLYKYVYLDKHTAFCPHYTADYLKSAVESGFLELRVLKKEKKVVGVFGFLIRNGTMIVPFFGYDTQIEEKVEIYRILTRLIIDEAEKRGVLLNDGSGGDTAKKFRGMEEVNEYAAIYTHHLPLSRKIFWGLSEKMAKLF